MAVPATIRTNNPGALWPGPSSKKFGATKFGSLSDGNKIAIFADPVQGAAAQFDLLNRSYVGLTLAAAMKKWTGNNSSEAELKLALRNVDATPDTVLTRAFLQNPTKPIPFAKGMAENETGTPYPLSDDDWMKAHTLAFPPAAKNGAGTWMDLARADHSSASKKKESVMISSLLHMILPASFWGWLGGSTGLLVLIVAGLYFSGGSKLVQTAGELVGTFAKPIVEKLGQFASNGMTWFGQGMRGIWDNPTVLVPMVLVIGFSVRYFEGPQIVARKKAQTELSHCIEREKKTKATKPRRAVVQRASTSRACSYVPFLCE